MRSVSAAEANRSFSKLLCRREDVARSSSITSHGEPVAKLVPFVDVSDRDRREAAQASHARSLGHAGADGRPIPWTRDDLYEDDPKGVRFAVDTNILVYAEGVGDEPTKLRRAREVLTRLPNRFSCRCRFRFSASCSASSPARPGGPRRSAAASVSLLSATYELAPSSTTAFDRRGSARDRSRPSDLGRARHRRCAGAELPRPPVRRFAARLHARSAVTVVESVRPNGPPPSSRRPSRPRPRKATHAEPRHQLPAPLGHA